MTAPPDNVVDIRSERAQRHHGVTFGHMRGLFRQALGAAILTRRPVGHSLDAGIRAGHNVFIFDDRAGEMDLLSTHVLFVSGKKVGRA